MKYCKFPDFDNISELNKIKAAKERKMTMTKVFRIGNQSFESIVSALRCVRELLDNYQPGDSIEPNETEFVNDLFKANPDYSKKVAGRSLSHFEVRTYKYQTRCFFAVFTNGEFIDFSFIKAIGELVRV